MERNYPIPVMVQDMLTKLANPALSPVERDNICAVIEEIEKACRIEASRYRKWRGHQHEEERKEMLQRRRQRRNA